LSPGQQLHGVVHLDMRREDQDGGLGKFLADHPSRLQAFDGVRGRHPDVGDHEVGDVLPDEVGELGGVAGLAHHLVAGALEQARQPFAEQDVVVGQNHPTHAHGTIVTERGLRGGMAAGW